VFIDDFNIACAFVAEGKSACPNSLAVEWASSVEVSCCGSRIPFRTMFRETEVKVPCLLGVETHAPAPTEAPATTTAAPSDVSCPSYGGYNVKQCSAEEDCCGFNTMSPQCVSKTSGDKCCTWFKSATTCNSTQSCCGMLGVGASSYAFCCNEGTERCQARTGYSGTATCCPAGTKCCSAASVGLC
jgi:hypothetical protein